MTTYSNGTWWVNYDLNKPHKFQLEIPLVPLASRTNASLGEPPVNGADDEEEEEMSMVAAEGVMEMGYRIKSC